MAAYECDHRNRLIGITEYDDQQNVLSMVAYAFDVFDRRIGKSVECDGLGGSSAVLSIVSWEAGQVNLQFDGDGVAD